MRIRRLGVILAAAGAAATMSLPASPAFAAHASAGGGATIEEFVCYPSVPDRIKLGTGKVITTPSGRTHMVCTGQPLQPR